MVEGHRLRLAGVAAIFCAEGIPEGDEGELLQGVKSWQARQYSVKLARDSICGSMSNLTQRKTRLGSQAPFGYDRQYLAPDGTLLRVLPKGERLPKAKSDTVRLVPGLPERVRTVKNMFERSAGGIGIRSIAMRLNAAGIRTPMGQRWEHTSVASILRNPVFKGSLVWNRTTKAKINAPSPDGTLRPPPKNPNGERNGHDQWVVVENTHEALVSADVWQRANDEIDRRSRMGGLARPTNRYLLSGLVKCTCCGFNFNGHKGGTGGLLRYYVDGAYMRYGRKGCDPTRVNADNLDAFVLAQVRQIIGGDSAAVVKAVDRFVKAAQAKAKPDDRRGQIEGDLKAVNKRIASAMALLADGDLDDLDELRETLVGLRKRRAALEAERASAGAGDATPTNAGDLRAWALKRFDEIGAALATDKAVDAMREVVQAYVIRIDIDPKERVGTLLLPADAMAILERDLAAISRVNTGEGGVNAIPHARHPAWAGKTSRAQEG